MFTCNKCGNDTLGKWWISRDRKFYCNICMTQLLDYSLYRDEVAAHS